MTFTKFALYLFLLAAIPLSDAAYQKLAGDVTGQANSNTVATVGGSTAAAIHTSQLATVAATAVNTASTIMKRDGSGQVAATTFTGALTGNANTATALASAPTACSGNNFALGVGVSGNASCAQPAFSNLSGTATIAQQTIATQAISSTAIDWSTGSVFTKTIAANTTFTFSNLTSGQTIVVRITGTSGHAYTSTWPTTSPVNVYWAGGANVAGANQPTQTDSTGGVHTDVWTFVYDGTQIWGSVVQNF